MGNRVHKKISQTDAEKIKNNQFLLDAKDLAVITEIENFVLSLQAQALKIYERKEQILLKLQTLTQQIIAITDKYTVLEDLSYMVPKDKDKLNDFLKSKPFSDMHILGVNNELSLGELLDISKTNVSSHYVEEKIKELTAIENQIRESLLAKEQELTDEKSNLIAERYTLQEKIHHFQQQHNYSFDVNEKVHLIKISRKGNGPKFSIIYGQGNAPKKFLLYTGKNFKLGSGAFGTVKLAQDCATNTLLAVKIQDPRALPEEALNMESSALDSMHRLQGVSVRSELMQPKHYTFMNLIYGENLEEAMKKAEENVCEKMLLMAAIELQNLHDQNKIHRDVKLENFMWDDELVKCSLIDLAFLAEVDGDKSIVLRDGAGSEFYQAPEIVDKFMYSKRSDIYAFGIILGELIKQHPGLRLKLQSFYDKFIADFDKRPLSLHEIIKFLKEEQADLSRESIDKFKRLTELWRVKHNQYLVNRAFRGAMDLELREMRKARRANDIASKKNEDPGYYDKN